jgi:transposase
MRKPKVPVRSARCKSLPTEEYDHLVAIDWSKATMAIARLTKQMREPVVIETRADLEELKVYLATLRGRTLLTFEETTTAHWLYVELHDSVERILICDPYRNRLLVEGPKTDKIDARKLCLLLKAGLLKEVYHSLEEDYHLRKIVSAYDDVVKAGVRLLNQRSAFSLADGGASETEEAHFVCKHLETGIAWYEETKLAYAALFAQLRRNDVRIRRLTALPGIADIFATKIVARVIDARRFPNAAHYLSYCGLIKHARTSGGRLYGRKSPRYCRTLKAVYKSAAMAALQGNNPMREYYNHLTGKGVAEHNARHAVARMLARISYGILKTATPYQPYLWRDRTKRAEIQCV